MAATEIADKMPASERQVEPPGIVAMAQLRNDNLKLRRTINIVSKAINRAIPGLAISGIKDEEAIRIWNECSK
jgi:hypothetical protein